MTKDDKRKTTLIILNGKARTGKDTFAVLSRDILAERNIQVFNISSIDPVKKAASLLGYSELNKNDQSREFLHDIKNAWVKFNEGALNYLKSEISKIDSGFIFIHIREAKEIEKFVKEFPETKTILLRRETGEELFNPADTKMEDYKSYSIIMENNGTLEEFKNKIKEVVLNLIKK